MSGVLIMAGGTGGHVFPALAVAHELRSRGVAVNWMGTQRGIEARLVPQAGISLHCISVQGLRGNGLQGWLLAPIRLFKAVLEARKVIKQVEPQVVLGLGGFASGPGGVAAWLSRIPLLIHEQNAVAGLTNRLLAPLAKRVMLGFKESFTATAKTQWVGNPVRAEIEQLASPDLRYQQRSGHTKLLVLGGSLGAKNLNRQIPQALAMLDLDNRPLVIHQCGEKHLAECQQNYIQSDVEATVVPSIEDMSSAYAQADLVICRAGALTVAEVAAAGVAIIFVPYPYAVDDHQTINARSLCQAGAAKLFKDSEMNAHLLADQLNQLLANRQQLQEMAMAARSQAKMGSAALIADECMRWING